MRSIKKIILHCTATQEGKDYSVDYFRIMHMDEPRMWSDIGYHYIIRNDENGTIEQGRPIERAGAHVRGHNQESIGIAYVGGVDKDLKAKDTMTPQQETSFLKLVESLRLVFGNKLPVYGHNDFTKRKECPSFKVARKFPQLGV
jgi:N-acetylmuramoyl-L-alanine amidase